MLLNRSAEACPPRRVARVPAGQRLYAIGDVHGRRDLLERLLDMVVEDAAARPGIQGTIVFLGDYVDRGPDSAGVIDLLCGPPPPGFGWIFLRGNHEAAMLRFLSDPQVGMDWLEFGGDTTLRSYGVDPPAGARRRGLLPAASRALASRLPPAHLSFLRTLRLSLRVGDYLFAHAGIRPGIALEAQREDDLLWIRDDFLRSTADHGVVVVHGHTITSAVETRPNRIGIDTGACYSGRLSCLVLEGETRRILQT